LNGWRSEERETYTPNAATLESSADTAQETNELNPNLLEMDDLRVYFYTEEVGNDHTAACLRWKEVASAQYRNKRSGLTTATVCITLKTGNSFQ